MNETFRNGFKTHRLLFDFTDYTRFELAVKWLLMPSALFVHTILFLWITLFFVVERLFAFVFRYFIGLQSKALTQRALTQQAFKKVYTLISVAVFVIFSPFIGIYYGAMFLKFIGKVLMKKLLLVLDFSRSIDPIKLVIFDDVSVHSTIRMSGMMKDLSNTETLGKSLEQMLNELEEDNRK